jgi:hypothetical protein
MIRLLVFLSLILGMGCVHAFDHTHPVWNGLLKRHVELINNGNGSRLSYTGMQAERPSLNSYLKQLSSVQRGEYDSWSKQQQLAFLINAYNAYTVELILTKYPDVTSIKDLGSFFKSPWKQRFFTLLGERRHLDNLEHDLIRESGVFAEPRIHFAVNCASIGCPMLRNEAYVADRLDHQLEDAMSRFLSDRERNYFDHVKGILWTSRIFDWYRGDFTGRGSGTPSLKRLFSNYADRLAEGVEAQQRLQQGDFRIDYLRYDWQLNDTL